MLRTTTQCKSYAQMLFYWVVAAMFGMLSLAHAQEQADLESIQQQIKDKQAQISQQLESAKALQESLKSVELQISETVRSLNQTEIALSDNQDQLKALEKQQQSYTTSLEQQKTVLSKQIRSAYMTGNYDFAKMLLNQQDAANFERTITYYQYLNKERKSQIDSFNQLVLDLQKVNSQLVDNRQELQSLKSQQLKQQETLKKQFADRGVTLVALQASIESEEAKVAQLQINEKNLLDALTRAQQQATQQNMTLDGLAKLKGRLLMPAEGRLRKMFGRFRQGQIKWKGVVIYGGAGEQVVAIHDAKVLYSDWLRGFGLVTVLDHGDGFMSLYGHNQALLKQAGDAVQAGDAIALLGQSGGQSRPNLYFEIRHKGKPINPVNWLQL